MRYLYLSLLLTISLCTCVRAQIPYLQQSPFTTTEITIATTKIEFSYGRPSLRGRTIFGGLEPWDVVWRGGANRNPRLVISETIFLAGQEIKAGSYTIFSKPNPEEWTIYIYDDINQFGTPEVWEEDKVVASLKIKPEKLVRPLETLRYAFEEISNDHFTLVLEWETTRVVIPFALNTKALIERQIERTLSGPHSSDYSNAGIYALRDSKDYEQAIAWFDQAIALDQTPSYWEHLHRARALEKLGRTQEAIAGAKRALELAMESNSSYGKTWSKELLARLE